MDESLAALCAELFYDRGRYVEDWPEDEAAAYREFGWAEGEAAARDLIYKKGAAAIMAVFNVSPKVAQ